MLHSIKIQVKTRDSEGNYSVIRSANALMPSKTPATADEIKAFAKNKLSALQKDFSISLETLTEDVKTSTPPKATNNKRTPAAIIPKEFKGADSLTESTSLVYSVVITAKKANNPTPSEAEKINAFEAKQTKKPYGKS